jgi:hypothetical protein
MVLEKKESFMNEIYKLNTQFNENYLVTVPEELVKNPNYCLKHIFVINKFIKLATNKIKSLEQHYSISNHAGIKNDLENIKLENNEWRNIEIYLELKLSELEILKEYEKSELFIKFREFMQTNNYSIEKLIPDVDGIYVI